MINPEIDIFKYCSYDIGELIISSQLLKFNNPKSFNDPFDCDINLLKFDFSERSEHVINEIEILKTNLLKEWGSGMESKIDDILDIL